LAKAPHNAETTAVSHRREAPNKMPFDHFKPAMAFTKRRPKMKDDHIAYFPYARPRCTTVKIHWYRHAMRQIENFDFDQQNKIRICCLARSLQARSLRLQLNHDGTTLIYVA
jgi:pterin-4a-carbinolamine dehydratase